VYAYFDEFDDMGYNKIGYYSDNKIYKSAAFFTDIFTYFIEDNILRLSIDGETISFVKNVSNKNKKIVGEWNGSEDNFVLLESGIGLFWNNEDRSWAKECRYITYSENVIYDSENGECKYSINNNILKVFINGVENSYVKTLSPKEKNITGFWLMENFESSNSRISRTEGAPEFFKFNENGVVYASYLGLGGIPPSIYYNGTIYSGHGKFKYEISDNKILVYDNSIFSQEEMDSLITLRKSTSDKLSGSWENGDDAELLFLSTGEVFFKSADDEYQRYFFNNGIIYKLYSDIPQLTPFHYRINNNTLILKPVSIEIDRSTSPSKAKIIEGVEESIFVKK
jgi:hypothetical protein